MPRRPYERCARLSCRVEMMGSGARAACRSARSPCWLPLRHEEEEEEEEEKEEEEECIPRRFVFCPSVKTAHDLTMAIQARNENNHTEIDCALTVSH